MNAVRNAEVFEILYELMRQAEEKVERKVKVRKRLRLMEQRRKKE